MGKFLENLGYIDGFDIIEIGKIRAKKDKMFTEIQKYDNDIMQDVQGFLNGGSGIIYALVKKEVIYGLYFFAVEKKDGKNSLKHQRTIYSDDVSIETRKKYEEGFIKLAKALVSYQDYEKVIFNDMVIQLDPKKSQTEIFTATAGGFALGFLLGWIITHNILMASTFGICFAPMFSGIDVVVQNKRGRKKNKKQ